MFNNLKEAEEACRNGEITIQDLDSLEVYFKAVDVPAEDVYALDDWYWDEDDECNLTVSHHAIRVTRKDIYRNYSMKDFRIFHDLIDCRGHILTKEEIRQIFWDMGN